MPRRLTGFVGAAALQLVALVLAHQLVYLARYGSPYGEALVHSGHGEAWSSAVSTSLLIAGGLASIAALRLAWLGLQVRRRAAAAQSTTGALGPRALLDPYLRIAPRLVVLAVVLLTVQENVEHALIGRGLPGGGILLTPEYAGGLWITIAVGLAVALVAALFEWRRLVLTAKLRATRPSAVRARTAQQPRLPNIERPRQSLLGRRSALRAPPLALAS